MKKKNKSTKKEARRIIGTCGLVCSECPAFIATKKNDRKLRKEVAAAWSKEFNIVVKPEDIRCEGCIKKDGAVISHCLECEIRICGQGRNHKNCAYCDEYMCEKLKSFIDVIPEALLTLESIRSILKKEN